MKFNWDESYSVGIKKFDLQHQEFFEIANKIYELIGHKDVNRDQLLSLITELNNYATYHLAAEESAFYEYNYPGYMSHVSAHDVLREKISEYVVKFMNIDTNLAILAGEIVDFATDWLVAHIKTTDKLYSDFLKDKKI